jgi:hypothetical protein
MRTGIHPGSSSGQAFARKRYGARYRPATPPRSVSRAGRSVLKRNADKIALPPDHAAFANGLKIGEGQFEIKVQRERAPRGLLMKFKNGTPSLRRANTGIDDVATSTFGSVQMTGRQKFHVAMQYACCIASWSCG